MFGDTFGSRADYTQGMMYASRRQFLVGTSRVAKRNKLSRKPCREEILRPPEIFMTRQQARRSAHSEQSQLRRLDFKSKGHDDGNRKEDARVSSHEHARRATERRRDKLAYDDLDDHESDLDMVDETEAKKEQKEVWEQVKQAGVVFWLNTLTGEATVESPFVAPEDDASHVSVEEEPALSPSHDHECGDTDEDPHQDTGVFDFLDTDDWGTS